MDLRLDASTLSRWFEPVMAGLVPAIHVLGLAGRKTWMPGSSPGMTTASSSASTMLRRRPNCQQLSSGLRLRRIVEKPLAENPVATPLLQRDLVDPAHIAGFIRQFE